MEIVVHSKKPLLQQKFQKKLYRFNRIPISGVRRKKLSNCTSGVGQRNPNAIPSVVRNPTPTPPKNLRLLTTLTPQPWLKIVNLSVNRLIFNAFATRKWCRLLRLPCSKPVYAGIGMTTMSVNSFHHFFLYIYNISKVVFNVTSKIYTLLFSQNTAHSTDSNKLMQNAAGFWWLADSTNEHLWNS